MLCRACTLVSMQIRRRVCAAYAGPQDNNKRPPRVAGGFCRRLLSRSFAIVSWPPPESQRMQDSGAHKDDTMPGSRCVFRPALSCLDESSLDQMKMEANPLGPHASTPFLYGKRLKPFNLKLRKSIAAAAQACACKANSFVGLRSMRAQELQSVGGACMRVHASTESHASTCECD